MKKHSVLTKIRNQKLNKTAVFYTGGEWRLTYWDNPKFHTACEQMANQLCGVYDHNVDENHLVEDMDWMEAR